MGPVVSGRIAALAAVTAAVLAGVVPLPALAALSVVVSFLGVCEVRVLRGAPGSVSLF